MKKIFIFILLSLVLTLSGCFKNKVVPNENEIKLYLDEEFTSLMPYDEVPSFTFTFNGSFNTLEYAPKTYYTLFATNDDVILSAEIAKLLATYQDRVDFEVVKTTNEASTRINTLNSENKQVAHKYVVDDGLVYDEVAYIALENGLKLTIDYRTFVSEGVTYYVWTYTNSLSMHVYYPLMVIKNEGKKQFLLLTLPNKIKFQVGPSLVIANITTKDTKDEYLQDSKYTFEYLAEHDSIKTKQQYVKDYYIESYNGRVVDDEFFFTYLDVDFKIVFYDTHFTVKFVSFI